MPEEVSVETDKVSDEVITSNAAADAKSAEDAKVEPKSFTEDYVKELRAEAAAHRAEKQKQKAENEALLARLKEFEDAKLTEQERLTRDFDEVKTKATGFESKLREAELRAELALAAREANIVDLKAALKLADRELIEYDTSGSITNMSDVIDSLRNEYPSLFNKAASAPNTGVTNPAKAPAVKKWTREDIVKMSPEKRVELMQKGEFNHLLGRKPGQ